MKVLRIEFETEESPYNPEFVEKILNGEKARKSGKPGLKIAVEDLWK